MNKILFVSGSVGLGHIIRDIEIAGELRKQLPEIEISWLASGPACRVIRENGEILLKESDKFENETAFMENEARGFSLSLIKYLYSSQKSWRHNVEVFKQVTTRYNFDLVIGDETYEITIALKENKVQKKFYYVMIYDFIGLDALTYNPLERIGVYIWNRLWANNLKENCKVDLSLFVGQPEDIRDRNFGLFLPNRRKLAQKKCKFIGHILPFDPSIYLDKNKVRKELGYGDQPLLICSVGGTSIGVKLLQLCLKSFSIIKEKIPAIKLILVCGPRISSDEFDLEEGVEIRQYVPLLYKHFAACDLAIIQGGGTTTLELTALKRPFIYFPLEGHCEQEVAVAERLARFNAGIKMDFSQTTPSSLADKVINNIDNEVNYSSITGNGAQKAAEFIKKIIKNPSRA